MVGSPLAVSREATGALATMERNRQFAEVYYEITPGRIVAEEADAVHLTVRGYLATAGRALEVDDGWATVLANWGPDATYWFGSTASRPAQQQEWRRTDDGWVPGAAAS